MCSPFRVKSFQHPSHSNRKKSQSVLRQIFILSKKYSIRNHCYFFNSVSSQKFRSGQIFWTWIKSDILPVKLAPLDLRKFIFPFLNREFDLRKIYVVNLKTGRRKKICNLRSFLNREFTVFPKLFGLRINMYLESSQNLFELAEGLVNYRFFLALIMKNW